MGFSRKYVRVVDKAKVFIFGFWLFLLGVGLCIGPGFIRRSKDAFDPPPNSPASFAQDEFQKYFPGAAQTSTLGVFIYSLVINPSFWTFPLLVSFILIVRKNETVLGPDLKEFTLKLNSSIYNWPCDDCIEAVSGYYVFTEMKLPLLATKPFLSPSNTSTIISIVIKRSAIAQDALDFADYLRGQIDGFVPARVTWKAELTGVSAFLRIVHESIESDFALMDGIVLPLALALLSVLLRSIRLLVLPILCIAISALVTFSIMYGITFIFDIVSFAPSLMMSLLIAMSIDYSLFLLSRYREELLAGKNHRQVVEIVVATAGHTIFVSGTTLAACFLGLVILPLNLMKSLGIGCSFTLVMIMLVNLTFVPACLLLFPNFFSACVKPFSFYCFTCTWGSKVDDVTAGTKITQLSVDDEDAHLENRKCCIPGQGECCAVDTREETVEFASINDGTKGRRYTSALDYDSEGNEVLRQFTEESSDEDTRDKGDLTSNESLNDSYNEDIPVIPQPKSLHVDAPYWYSPGSLFLTPLVICVVIVAIVPFAMHAFHYPTSSSFLMTMPRQANVTKTYERMLSEFGLYPYQLLMVPSNGTSILSPLFHSASQRVVHQLATSLPNTTSEDFMGFSAAPFPVMWSYASRCLKSHSQQCNGIHYSRKMFVNEGANATFFLITLKFSPMSPEGFDWYYKASNLIQNISLSTGINLSLSGMPANNADAVFSVNKSFWWMILMTCCVVLVFIAISFRSVPLPFRSVLTISLTLMFVYGFSDMTFVHGWLDTLHFQGLHGYGSIYWAPPIVSFSIIVGIGLDYDIFLLVRIKEYRDLGYTTPEAIALGFAKTGHIITAAGVIMAVAFSGLLFSDVPGMNMLSFYMAFSVLFDTFVVRSLLVPSTMSLLRDFNWWPGRLSPIRRIHDKKIIPFVHPICACYCSCCPDPDDDELPESMFPVEDQRMLLS